MRPAPVKEVGTGLSCSCSQASNLGSAPSFSATFTPAAGRLSVLNKRDQQDLLQVHTSPPDLEGRQAAYAVAARYVLRT